MENCAWKRVEVKCLGERCVAGSFILLPLRTREKPPHPEVPNPLTVMS